jgi:ribonuclease HI
MALVAYVEFQQLRRRYNMALWRRATFKGSKVWVEVEPDGKLIEKDRRVTIRYAKKGGARLYRASIDRVDGGTESDLVEMEPGTPPPDGPATSGSSSRRSPRAAALKPPPAGAVIAYTDGACIGNPGPAGSGALVQLPDGRCGQASRSLGLATNNVGELDAIGLALDLMEEAGVEEGETVVIYSDSNYARGVLTLGWKAKANRTLILELRERLASWTALEIRWVPGHEGVDGNEQADGLAGEGAQGITKTKWD